MRLEEQIRNIGQEKKVETVETWSEWDLSHIPIYDTKLLSGTRQIT